MTVVQDLVRRFELKDPTKASSSEPLQANQASPTSPPDKTALAGNSIFSDKTNSSLHHHLDVPMEPRTDLQTRSEISAVSSTVLNPVSDITGATTSRTTLTARNFEEEEDGEDFLLNHSYPPTELFQKRSATLSRKSNKLSGLPRRRRPTNLPSHIPIAASVVFSRTAMPLYLPILDKYLSTLPNRPAFLDEARKESPAMFPPMDMLAKLGMTVDDLEHNSAQTPPWRDRKSILGVALDWSIGILGSSVLASFYSLQGLFNTVQIFALLLSTIVPVSGKTVENSWRKLFLGTIPNVLALNFASTLVQSLLFLVLFMAMAACLLHYFHRATSLCNRYQCLEGLQKASSRGKQWGLVIVTFILTVIYLPLSTMAVHVLVWSQDLWIVPNPYVNATIFPPESLGPSAEFREPLDFCWTTTMKRNEVNYAPVFVVLSAVVVASLTLWYPIALRRVIQESVPKVDGFTELGRPRNAFDMDGEYQRLLERDKNPFAFLYRAFRRGWGTYESTYLLAKLSTLVIIAVIDSNNCLFRSFSRTTVPVVRQILLLLSTLGFFFAQCLLVPFLDHVNNASEWTSRLNYVLTSIVALLVALDVPGKNVIDTYVLYGIYIVTYGLSLYFSIIHLDISQRLVKRLMRRIDFSVDIFSPSLDISLTSIHTKRRIWQETITTLFLTNLECKIPKEQQMAFAQARDSEYPPYLLDFRGSPGERHVENLKILREIGSDAYNTGITCSTGFDNVWYKHLSDNIQRNFLGPDSYWKNEEGTPRARGSFFGNSWWIPFPPTLVIRYDDGTIAVLKERIAFESFISQNSSPAVQRRRSIRLALRSLEGQTVYWPFEHVKQAGSSLLLCCGRRGYVASDATHFRTCVLTIKHRGHLLWQGLQLGSGFDVELRYSKEVCVSGETIGINDDYELTPLLARFLELNQEAIQHRLPRVEAIISNYRLHHRNEFRRKAQILSYNFLTNVYEHPRAPEDLFHGCIGCERDLRVRALLLGSEAVFQAAYLRMATVQRSEAATWWYIFWDDLWRRNYDTISQLNTHAADFNPHYPTSIAYTPLPRAALETFLSQRGLFHKSPQRSDFFHQGFLNKLYLRLNDAVFRDSKQAVMFHLDDDGREFGMDDIDNMTQGRPSTLGTGAGTDHDDDWIRNRPTYRWEGLLGDPLLHGSASKWHAKLAVWFGITPFWRYGPVNRVSLDVRLVNGRYILLDHQTLSNSSIS